MRYVPRNFVDKLSDAWRSSPSAVPLGAGAGIAFQLVLTMFTDVESIFSPSWLWWGWMGAQNGALLFRRRAPFIALLVECLALLTAEVLFGAGDFCLIPMLIAAYSVASRSRPLLVLIGAVMCVLAYTPVLLFRESGGGAAGIFPLLFYVGAAMAIGFSFRLRRSSLAERDAVLNAEDAVQTAERKRLHADRSARMAGSLHDSVGHNLTAIAAISEGLKGRTRDSEIEEALEFIDDLARSALTETREVVRIISHADEPDAVFDSQETHDWDDIADLADTVRRTGIAVAIVENGTRPKDPNLQESCYAVIRESLTNVIRHASNVTRVTVSLEYTLTSIRISVADNGDMPQSTGSGSGLTLMRNRLHDLGGTLETQSTDMGWILRAMIPTGDNKKR